MDNPKIDKVFRFLFLLLAVFTLGGIAGSVLPPGHLDILWTTFAWVSVMYLVASFVGGGKADDE